MSEELKLKPGWLRRDVEAAARTCDEERARLFARMLKDEAVRLRALADQLDPPSPQQPEARAGWMPIESAPKDRTNILVAKIGKKPVRAFQTPEARWFMHSSRNPLEGRDLPTHWRPLPPAPGGTDEQEADGGNAMA